MSGKYELSDRSNTRKCFHEFSNLRFWEEALVEKTLLKQPRSDFLCTEVLLQT